MSVALCYVPEFNPESFVRCNKWGQIGSEKVRARFESKRRRIPHSANLTAGCVANVFCLLPWVVDAKKRNLTMCNFLLM